MGDGRRELLTVGHSTHPLDAFLDLLAAAGVEALADVRRFPGSRRHPHFARDALAPALEAAGIAYRHLGQLGGRRRGGESSPGAAGWRVAAFRAYAEHLRSDEFAAGRAELEALAGERRTAVMCAEAQWWRCHRRLIADVFACAGWRVRHLMPNGTLVDHELPEFAVCAEDGLPAYPAGGQEALFGG